MRLALVTGGSRGLGLALCDALSAQGWRIIDFSRSAPHAYSVRVDLAAPEGVCEAVREALAPFAGETLEALIVVNNAGMLEPIGPTSRKPNLQLIANMNANFTSAILFMTEVVATFQSQRCRKVIVNISSGAALRGYAGWSLYCAAKAGVENFVRSVAVEQQSEAAPFTPINIGPGVIDTEMQALIRSTSAADFPDVDRFVKRKVQGELRSPTAVAAAILRIVSLPDLVSGERYDVANHEGPR